MLLFLLLCATTSAIEKYRTVQTRFGTIRGKSVTSYGGHSGYEFSGIPMAKPPVGQLRFKSPVDPDPWTGVLDTLQYRNACVSDPVRTYKTDAGGPISEDCLYVNVFTSKTCLTKGGCAVMAVVHGGHIRFESPVIFRQDVIINNFANEERNVVVLTLPYRVGAFGLFQLAQEINTSIDSNVVLRDCIFGLNWIQREIEAFGGNPAKVTLMGHSAGASLAHMLALVPSTAGMFTQVIPMSGPDNGGDVSKIANTKHSREIAKLLGCASKNEKFENKEVLEQIIQCLRSKGELDILNTQKQMNNKVEELSIPWVDGSDGVFPNYLQELKKFPRKLNVMIGTVPGEFRDILYSFNQDGTMNPTHLDVICTFYGYLRNHEKPEKFVPACVDFYSKPNRTELLDDHYLFYSPAARFADLFTSAKGKAYVYSFEYQGIGDVFNKYSKKRYPEPSHSEDYVYIFGMHRKDSAMKSKDFEIEKIYSGMVANFVNYGDPSFENKWTQWNPNSRNYFLIDFDKKLKMPGMKNGYYNEASQFWENISEGAGGQWTPLESFPPSYDVYEARSVITIMTSVWNNESLSSDKTISVMNEAYGQWATFVRGLKVNRQLQLSANSSDIPHADYEATFNWVTISLASVVVLLVVYILVDKMYQHKKRRDYNTLE